MEAIKELDVIKTKKTYAGLVEAKFEYKIASTSGFMDYLGPTIPPHVWHQVVSFFRWTYDTMHSESQARLYVNPIKREWRAWAFPQEARTGMTAKELHTTETPEQAAERFRIWGTEPSGDWVYFMTAHHHCSAGAFQSGTDMANEKGQDGLHVTVGDMDKASHSLHARFYVSSTEFNVDLSTFWDVGDLVRQQVPSKSWHDCAVYQMTRKMEIPFPDQWKANVIEMKRDFFGVAGGGATGGSSSSSSGSYVASGLGYRPVHDWRTPIAERCAEAMEEILNDTIVAHQDVSDAKKLVQLFAEHPIAEIIFRNCKWKNVDCDDIMRYIDVAAIPDDWETNEMTTVPFVGVNGKDTKQLKESNQNTPTQTGIPDYDGISDMHSDMGD